MNANLREYYGATVLTNEAIEVHLSYLRPAVEAMHAELPELRKEIKALDTKLTEQVMKLQGSLDGLKWFISSLTLLTSGISIARSLGSI